MFNSVVPALVDNAFSALLDAETMVSKNARNSAGSYSSTPNVRVYVFVEDVVMLS